jgi:hypothetical protein
MSNKTEADYEQMEAEFQKVFDEHHPEIQAKIAAAAKLLAEAEELAEKHGLPFRPKTSVLGFRMSYIPESLDQKFPELEQDFWSHVTGAYGGYDYAGWQSSQVC